MPWLLIGYMFLFIHRPFEVWPVLGDLRIERIYMIGTILAWFVHSGKRLIPNLQHLAYACFATSVLSAWIMSPWMEKSQPLVEDYFKIIVFYVLLVTTIRDEAALKKVVIGLVAVMAVYLGHSFREFMGGRHVYRMGIVRMVGVDSTMGDPNSFGATIVFVLPFVAALWRSGIGGRWGQLALLGYTGLSSLCILLTGSRSSLLGLLAWFAIVILGHRKRFLFLGLMALAAPGAFVALPDSLQNRFETIINPDVGPANAKESGEGRVQGLLTGFELWSANPLAGVGPGAWRPATKSPLESHNLYGQLVGELGAIGLVSFLFILWGFWRNTRRMKRILRDTPEWRNDLLFQVSSAVTVSVVLLLFMGNFGHNLFRYSWLWYGGFLIIARHCAEARAEAYEEGEYMPPELWAEMEEHEELQPA
ncbi:MAG: O-antigen ligase family protein [Fimbriiglobus sp.]